MAAIVHDTSPAAWRPGSSRPDSAIGEGFDVQRVNRRQRGCRGCGGRRRGSHPLHAGHRPVPDGPRHVGDERVHRDGGGGSGHDCHRRPDGHHPLHVGHGQSHGPRGQGGQHHRPQAGFLPGLHHLRLWLDDDRPVPQPHGADHWLVVSRRYWRGAYHAGHRRAGRRELRALGAPPSLRTHCRGGGHRHRRRPRDRRLHDHLLLVALRLRR